LERFDLVAMHADGRAVTVDSSVCESDYVSMVPVARLTTPYPSATLEGTETAERRI